MQLAGVELESLVSEPTPHWSQSRNNFSDRQTQKFGIDILNIIENFNILRELSSNRITAVHPFPVGSSRSHWSTL